MNWLRRREREAVAVPLATEEPPPTRHERRSPGGAALFEGIAPDRSHSILDLGTATNASLQLYSRYARWIRFADLLSPEIPPEELAEALEAIPCHPERPYDLVIAWDLLDRTEPEQRSRVIERLAEVTGERARLFLIVDSPRDEPRPPLYFGFVAADRVWSEEANAPPTPRHSLLPAAVEALVSPFQVMRAFTTRAGMREYVARRGRTRKRA